MFRGLIALLIACVLTLTGLTAPAYADSNHVGGLSMGAKQLFDSHDIIIVNPPQPDFPSPGRWEHFLKGLGDGALETAGLTIGGAAVCFAVDGVATTFFPPAAALLAYCPGFGATIGGGSVVSKGVNAVAKAL